MSSRFPGAVALSLLLAGTLMSCDDDTSVHLGSSSQSTVTTSKPFVNAGGGALYATVTVALKDDGGIAVFGKAITLISSRGYKDTIGVNAGATDKNGVASFIVQSSTVGKATLTAVDTTDAVGIDQTVDVTFAGPVDAGVSTVTASPTTVLADGTTASIITVTLKDSAGTPVDGKTISLQQPAGGTADINGNVTSPDQIGVRTFDVTSLNTGSVVFNGIDQTDSIIPTQTVTVTFTPTERHNSTIAASPYAVTADGATTSTITVTLKDPNGASIPGHGVALHSSRNAADTIAIVSDTTNSSGVATFTIKSANPGQSTLSATDTTNNLDLVPTVVVGFSEYTFVATGAAVNFTVPAGVTTLNVSAAGGAGGIGQFRGPDTRALGAEGASISAVNFTVVAGHVLQVVTGGLGGHGRLVNGAGGGGGGTSLYDSTSSTSFFILGGGGGDSNSTEGCAASTTTTPNNCGGTGGGQNTALNGTGGGGGNAAGGGGGGGGRADPGTDGAVGGQGPGLGGGGGYAATGGLGTQVSSSLSGNGAFGTAAGGGGGTSNGGGGGGYVGGGGGKSSGLGGGAASFCSVATTISADNLGDGFVTISW